jgi:hypothetical protein
VLQINLVSYSFTNELITLCEEHGLVRAQGHILLSKCKGKDPNFTFFKALQSFHKMMRNAFIKEQQQKQDENDNY